MAEQILKVKLQADVTGAVGLVKAVNEQEKGMTALEKVTKELGQTWKTLQDRVTSGNELIAKGIQNHGLALYNTTKAARDYKKALEDLQTIKWGETLGAGINALKPIETRGYVPFSMGTLGGKREAEQAVSDSRAQTLQEAETRAFLARRTKVEKEWADSLNTVVTPAVKTNTEALKKNKAAVEETGKSHRSLGTHILEVIGIYRIYNASINTILNSLQAIPKIGIELESTKASLMSTIGSEAGMGSALAALNEEATRTGIGINSLRESFRNFQASTSLSGVSLKETWQMFTNMNTVITALHLSTDQATHIFNALAQIFNKSKVQSEELVKQLGNLLPGAFASFQKANVSAYKSTQELVQAMKQGTVFAQDTMLNFTIFLKDRFAASFAVASQGFNANVGRMQNSFTLLGEAIYNTSSGALNDAVKLITDITNTLTGAVTGANNFGETLKQVSYVIESVLIVAIVKAISNSNALKMSLLSLGGNAVLTAIGTAATALLNIGREQASIYEQAIARQKEFTDQKTLSDTAKPLEIRVEASKSVQEARKQLADLKKELGRVNSTEASIVYVGEERGTIAKEAALEDLNKAISFQKELITKTIDASRLEILKADEEARKAIVLNGVNLEADIAKARENALKAQGKTTEGAIQEFTNTYGDKIEAAKKEIKSLEALAISGTEDQKIYAADKLSKLNQFLSDLDTQKAKLIKDANKKVTTPEISEAYKASLGDVKNTALELQNSVSMALTDIDILYQQNAMSIETYFSQKIQLQETDLAVQKEMLNQELQLAYAQKDKVKIQKLNGELIKAETDANKLATKTIIEKTNAERELQTSLANINAEYAKTFGTLVTATEAADAAEQKFLATNGALILKLSLLADAGDELAAKRLKQLYSLKDSAVIDEQLNDLATKRNALAAEYDATLQRIADRTTAGFPDIWGTASDEALAKYKTGMAEIAEKQKEILSSQGTGISLSDNAKKEVAKTKEILEDLKGKSGYIAEQMNKAFNDSFSNAFTGFIAGTDSASKAFSNFATSMIGSIQRILAQKMAETLLSSFITPALSNIGSGFMGLFSSSVSGATAATMGTGPMLAAANGGVFSGSGISAYSGSIVSKPTIFPFAKGTGLMGEAGPEAILPLTRNSKGKLGVIADSTGQSGGNVYNIAVTVQSSKDEKPADTGQKIAEAMMRTIAKQEIGLAARPGNSLNRTTKFG